MSARRRPYLCLLRDFRDQAGNAGVIRAVVQLASDLGQRVVAAGVERPEEEAALSEMGLRYAPWFPYGAPAHLPAPAAARASGC